MCLEPYANKLILQAENGRIVVTTSPNSIMASQLRELGFRWNPSRKAMVYGKSNKVVINEAKRLVAVFNNSQKYLSLDLWFDYFVSENIMVTMPKFEHGFILSLRNFSKNLVEELKSIDGSKFFSEGFIWRVPVQKFQELNEILIRNEKKPVIKNFLTPDDVVFWNSSLCSGYAIFSLNKEMAYLKVTSGDVSCLLKLLENVKKNFYSGSKHWEVSVVDAKHVLKLIEEI